MIRVISLAMRMRVERKYIKNESDKDSEKVEEEECSENSEDDIEIHEVY